MIRANSSEMSAARRAREQAEAEEAERAERDRALFAGGLGAARKPQALGGEMFPVLLANAVRDGHLTESEAEERYALHKLAFEAD